MLAAALAPDEYRDGSPAAWSVASAGCGGAGVKGVSVSYWLGGGGALPGKCEAAGTETQLGLRFSHTETAGIGNSGSNNAPKATPHCPGRRSGFFQ
jgi:hypothetical protein